VQEFKKGRTDIVTIGSIVDGSPPDTAISSGPSALTTSTSATFSFTGTDSLSATSNLTFECSLDGASYSACTSPRTYTGLAGGSHIFSVRAIDEAGNADATPAAASWTVDAAAPDTSITSAPAAIINQTSASFAFAGTDDVTAPASLTFECSLDGAAYAACT